MCVCVCVLVAVGGVGGVDSVTNGVDVGWWRRRSCGWCMRGCWVRWWVGVWLDCWLGWLAGLAGWAGWVVWVGWQGVLVGWLVGWLDGCLVGWLRLIELVSADDLYQCMCMRLFCMYMFIPISKCI